MTSMSPENQTHIPSVDTSHLVLALVSISGSMTACADHGDAATLRVLSSYYALVADAIASAGGRIVLGAGPVLSGRSEHRRAAKPDWPPDERQAWYLHLSGACRRSR